MTKSASTHAIACALSLTSTLSYLLLTTGRKKEQNSKYKHNTTTGAASTHAAAFYFWPFLLMNFPARLITTFLSPIFLTVVIFACSFLCPCTCFALEECRFKGRLLPLGPLTIDFPARRQRESEIDPERDIRKHLNKKIPDGTKLENYWNRSRYKQSVLWR